MSESAQLFVYGTLLPGEPNAHVLAGARRMGPAATTASYDLLDLGDYPALRTGGATSVTGELYLVEPDHLALLDDFEGHPTLFVRASVSLAGGGTAQAYLFPAPLSAGAGAPPLPVFRTLSGGDWRRRHDPA